MKITEMRQLAEDALQTELASAHKELFNLRMQHGLRQLENVAQLRSVKHRVAQLKTVLREKQLAQTSGGQTK